MLRFGGETMASEAADYPRAASHAGSWYTAEPGKLAAQLDTWLAEHSDDAARDAVGVIGPHAGLRYSGRTAAACYAQLAKRTSLVARILLLGPSHHVGIRGCALSRASSLETPLGSLPVDTAAVAALAASGAFDDLTREEDEAEHSLEMQLPYLARCLQWRAAGRAPSAGATAPATLAPLEAAAVVPILVGGIRGREAAYAALLAPLLRDGRTFVVVSSDFCHWGSRFSYTRYDREAAGRSGCCIADGIEAMDRRGMQVRSGGMVGLGRAARPTAPRCDGCHTCTIEHAPRTHATTPCSSLRPATWQASSPTSATLATRSAAATP